MIRASYKRAIQWLADNDDCEWLNDGPNASMSVSCALVADLFAVDDARVQRDLRAERSRPTRNPAPVLR